ncbi:MAG: glycosyltransferase family 4 protein [Candidatus Sabulitectum sp.]|nr:glycosyltransferase family 4 protein [Candidatus Sabulitectum sp.]
MKRSVLLNWLPFENTSTGAAKRSVEIHERLADEFNLTAAVTEGFPSDTAPGVEKNIFAAKRSLAVRLSERFPGFWERQGRPDVWVTDTLPVPAFKSDTRTVLTVHDLRFLVSRKYLSLQRYLLLKLTMKSGLKRADVVVTVSDWIAEQIIEYYGISPKKLYVIPNAAASLPSARSLEFSGREYILTVGHLEPRKDQRTLIRAFAMVAGKWDGDLVVVGRGALLGDLELLADELGLGSRVKFAEGVGDSELSDLYARSTCLVCPSVYEGFGMTLLEGMAAELPVIASSIPSHREVAGDVALWFEPGNCKDLAEVILSFLENRQNFIPDAGVRRARKYNWNNSAKKLASIYRELLFRERQ